MLYMYFNVHRGGRLVVLPEKVGRNNENIVWVRLPLIRAYDGQFCWQYDFKVISPHNPDTFRFRPSVHRGGHQAVC